MSDHDRWLNNHISVRGGNCTCPSCGCEFDGNRRDGFDCPECGDGPYDLREDIVIPTITQNSNRRNTCQARLP